MIRVRPQGGFGLVELMIALAIGLVIMLGAGQLFLTGFQGFQRVEALGDRQAALTFASDVLVREMRGDDFDVAKYGLVDSESGEGCTLRDNEVGEPIVDGFSSSGDGCKSVSIFEENHGGVDGLYRVTFDLSGESEPIVFHVMSRNPAVGGR